MTETAGDAIRRAAQRYVCYATPFMMGLATRGNPYMFALAVPASILLSEPYCERGQPPEPYPAYGRPTLGGQCSAVYNVNVRGKWKRGDGFTLSVTSGLQEFLGPISAPYQFDTAGTGFTNKSIYITDGTGTPRLMLSVNSSDFPNDVIWLDYGFSELSRRDGGSDNCGSLPPAPYPVPVNPWPLPPGYEPDEPGFLPEYERDEPYRPSPDREPIFLPIVFPPVVIPFTPIFPITVPINVGGVNVGGIKIGFDGTINVTFEQIADKVDTEGLRKLLLEIKECACDGGGGGGVTVETIALPVLKSEGCESETLPLSVQTGAYTTTIANRVQATVQAAVTGCKSLNPEQKPEVLLGSGTVPSPATEQFVTGVTPEIVSVRLKITSVGDAIPVSTFPAAAQYKFGSMAFSLQPARAGGDYIYVFDSDTYYPLPRHASTGLIRLLLRSGVSWELYDTGERL